MSAPILGLDLGTSTCLACAIHQGRTVFVRPDLAFAGAGRDRDDLDYPGELMPSAFCLKDGRPLVGYRALDQLKGRAHARDVVREVKRTMHLDGQKTHRSGGRDYAPSEVTAEYIKVLIRAAALELKLPAAGFKRAVVTVPADFPPRALSATMKACALAGLSEDGVQLVDEPVAAAYSLGLHLEPGKRRVLMIDLGGGTFDVALWDVGRDVGTFGFDELGRDGDARLGGLDWDREIADWTLQEVRPRFEPDVFRRLLKDTADPGNADLFRAAEEAKRDLSILMKRAGIADRSRPIDHLALSPLTVKFLPTADQGEALRSARMPVEVFFRRSERLMRRCVEVCERLFRDVKTIQGLDSFGWADLDCVYLAGGGSRLPIVQRRFAECSPNRPPILNDNPQHAVVKGAALLGELWRNGQALPSVIGKARYMRSIGLLRGPESGLVFEPIIPRNQPLPFKKSYFFTTNGDPSLTKIRLRFAEERHGLDGPRHDLIQVLKFDVPPARPGSPPEEATVKIECGIEGKPSFRLTFRGRDFDEDLGNLPEAPRPSPSPNGSTKPTVGDGAVSIDRA